MYDTRHETGSIRTNPYEARYAEAVKRLLADDE